MAARKKRESQRDEPDQSAKQRRRRPAPTDVPSTKADERRAQELIEKYGWRRQR